MAINDGFTMLISSRREATPAHICVSHTCAAFSDFVVVASDNGHTRGGGWGRKVAQDARSWTRFYFSVRLDSLLPTTTFSPPTVGIEEYLLRMRGMGVRSFSTSLMKCYAYTYSPQSFPTTSRPIVCRTAMTIPWRRHTGRARCQLGHQAALSATITAGCTWS